MYGQMLLEVLHIAHHLLKNQYEIQVFSCMRFSCDKTSYLKNFSGSVHGRAKKPGFLDFGFNYYNEWD